MPVRGEIATSVSTPYWVVVWLPGKLLCVASALEIQNGIFTAHYLVRESQVLEICTNPHIRENLRLNCSSVVVADKNYYLADANRCINTDLSIAHNY
jgi:hypothetical protein